MITKTETNSLADQTRGLVRPSARADVVDIGILRDRRATAGSDISVRAIAAELKTSSGRVGDLLKIRDAFSDDDVDVVGVMRDNDDPPTELVGEAGTRRLCALSFRALRALAALPPRKRRIETLRITSAFGGAFAERIARRATMPKTSTDENSAA